jgi:hypothetical protein
LDGAARRARDGRSASRGAAHTIRTPRARQDAIGICSSELIGGVIMLAW